jgi:hypothetical protein
MPVRYLFKDIHTEPLRKLHDALLVAGRAKMAALAGKCQQVFMAAVVTSYTGKAVAQIAAIQVTINHLFDIRPPEAVISGKPVIINLYEAFKVILHAGIIVRVLRPPGAVFLRH